MSERTGLPISVGDRVIKDHGDYTFEGEVRAIVVKRSGQYRYVVEDDRGLLFIFSAYDLRVVLKEVAS